MKTLNLLIICVKGRNKIEILEKIIMKNKLTVFIFKRLEFVFARVGFYPSLNYRLNRP